MTDPPLIYEALARALTPPRGEARVFRDLGLPAPDADALMDEHANLFGRAGHALLAPYEGVHRGTALHEVLAEYARFGFAPDRSFRDRPDHICLQLALAAVLNRRAGDAAQRFFHLRIWPWVPIWFDTLASFDEYPAHCSLACVAVGFLEREGERLGAPPREGRSRKEPAAEPRCAECGQPVGFTLPREGAALPAWARVCARCRFRLDLRRLGS